MPNLFEQSYRVTDSTTLDPIELNNRFKSIDARIAALEAEKASLEATIVELRAEGVTRLTSSLQTELPSILDAAGTGYLTGLADNSIPWPKIDMAGLQPGHIGAEVAGAVATHESTPGVHSISDVAGLSSEIAGKQNYSAFLSAIASEPPTDGGVIVGTGTTYQVEELIAGDSIEIVRNNGTLRINATGSASGESNNGLNLGAGAQVYEGKTGTDLRFRSLVPSSDAIQITESDDEISIGFSPTELTVNIGQVNNLTASLSAKQAASANLSALAALTPNDAQVVTGTGTGFEMAALNAGDNITITPGVNNFTISAAATSYAFSNLGVSSGGREIFKTTDGNTVQFRTIRSLNNALTLFQGSNTVDLDFSASTFFSGLSNDAISWAKVNKSGATAAQVGAEPAGAVSTHAGNNNAHPIAGVAGLQSALDERLKMSDSSVQTMETAIAIQQGSLSGTSPTPNADDDNYWTLTLTGNTTINNPTGLPSGKLQILTFLIMGGAGGHSLNWGNDYVWGDSGEPDWALAAGDINLVSFLAATSAAAPIMIRAHLLRSIQLSETLQYRQGRNTSSITPIS